MTKTITLMKPKNYQVKTIKVNAGVRYWEDATVNGSEDSNGDMIPCRKGDSWQPVIDVDSGQILNWTKGVVASVHYKVCDSGEYELLDEENNTIMKYADYVPTGLSPGGSGYGDYIIMDIDENGFIDKWFFETDFWEEYYENAGA